MSSSASEAAGEGPPAVSGRGRQAAGLLVCIGSKAEEACQGELGPGLGPQVAAGVPAEAHPSRRLAEEQGVGVEDLGLPVEGVQDRLEGAAVEASGLRITCPPQGHQIGPARARSCGLVVPGLGVQGALRDPQSHLMDQTEAKAASASPFTAAARR